MTGTGIRAVIFDLDGTILDSEPAYWESDRAFLAGWGMEYDAATNEAMAGRGARAFMEIMEELFPGKAFHRLPMEERIRLKDEAYLAHARTRVRAFPSVEAFIAWLHGRGVPMAVASGSSREVIDATLDGAGLLWRFPVRVSAQDVARGQPEPDVFLEAARRLGVEPETCLVLEDSVYGLRAAKAAGMRAVALPSSGAAGGSAYPTADLVVPGGAGAFDMAMVLERWDIGTAASMK